MARTLKRAIELLHDEQAEATSRATLSAASQLGGQHSATAGHPVGEESHKDLIARLSRPRTAGYAMPALFPLEV